MAWTEKELKIFASGLAIGGQWNHVGDSSIPVPNIDPLPGNYLGQIIHVRLWSDVPDAVVRATFDGSIPSATAEPISPNATTDVDVDTVVRAFAQVNNKTSKIATYKFTFNNPFDVSDIIVIENATITIDDYVAVKTECITLELADTIDDRYLLTISDSSEQVTT